MLVSLWVQAAPSAPGGAGVASTGRAGVADGDAVGEVEADADGVAAGPAFLPAPLQAARARTQGTRTWWRRIPGKVQ